jgi:hypothetical protein
MTLPIIAITNASTCLTDIQVSAAIPALQQQVSLDFKAYWDLDCQLEFLSKDEPLSEGWWQISVTDNPDQAGALGYHELSSRGTPLGKVFAGLDLESGGSWTVTLSHELLEMLADPWINWCAQGTDGKIYALESATRSKLTNWDMRSIECWSRTSSLLHGLKQQKRTESISSSRSRDRSSLLREDTFQC